MRSRIPAPIRIPRRREASVNATMLGEGWTRRCVPGAGGRRRIWGDRGTDAGRRKSERSVTGNAAPHTGSLAVCVCEWSRLPRRTAAVRPTKLPPDLLRAWTNFYARAPEELAPAGPGPRPRVPSVMGLGPGLLLAFEVDLRGDL